MRMIVSVLLVLATPLAVAAAASLDCRANENVAFKAEHVDNGNNSAINVQFAKRPSAAVATKIVEACMQVVVNQYPARELLGSAWVGDAQFRLAPGKEHLVYFPREKKIRPFGLDEALTGLKKKEPNAESPSSAFDNFTGLTAMTREIKSHMRDPDSFSVAKYGRKSSDGTQCMIYRARNGFGGVDVGYAVLSDKKSQLNDPAFFKKMCAGL